MASAARTVVLPVTASGAVYAPLWLAWPVKQTADMLDYSLDVSAVLADASDSIASVTVDAAPSGTGEIVIADVAVSGGIITSQISGGVSGRPYIVRLAITGVSGRVWQCLVGLLAGPGVSVWPIPVPVSSGFGTPITWTSGAAVFGPSFVGVMDNITVSGTTQGTATLFAAQTNIVVAQAQTGAAGKLPAIISGTLWVMNRISPAADLLIFPPIGYAFEGGTVNSPATLSPSGIAAYTFALGATNIRIS